MRSLLRLLADNRGVARPMRVRASADGESTTINLYDAIVSDDFWGGVSAKAIANALAEVKTPRLDLRINSPGGDVFAGKTIAQLVKEHPAEVTVHVDGLAASAASLVAIAGDRVVMGSGSFLMVHRSWVLIAGNMNDMLETAALLEKVDGTIADEYARVAGVTPEQAMAWMDAETWFTAQEAVDAGLATDVAPEDTEEPQARWKLGAYGNVPAGAALKQEAPAVLVSTYARADAERKLRIIEISQGA